MKNEWSEEGSIWIQSTCYKIKIQSKNSYRQRTNYLTKYISCGKHKNAYNLCDDCIVFPAKDNYQMDDYQLEKNCLCT